MSGIIFSRDMDWCMREKLGRATFVCTISAASLLSGEACGDPGGKTRVDADAPPVVGGDEVRDASTHHPVVMAPEAPTRGGDAVRGAPMDGGGGEQQGEPPASDGEVAVYDAADRYHCEADADCDERATVTASVASGSPEVDPSPLAFCAQGAHNRVTEIFCGGVSIKKMSDLLAHLDRGSANTHAFALGHSTALSGRLVSAINPRVIRTYSTSGNSGFYAALAFVRGEQRVELAAREGERLHFYLFEFKQACNSAPTGCTPGDLFTSAVETGWLSFTVRSDEELKNTPLDCRRCHGGSPEEAVLLMRELAPPWSHWFNNEFFQELDIDFLLSRGEHIDLIAGARIGVLGAFFSAEDARSLSSPGFMESLARNQGRSPLPPTGYDLFLAGDGPASPYVFSRVADPAKLREMSARYLAFLDGDLPRDEVPDLANVFVDVPRDRAEIGLAVELNATGPELLLQACAECHNDRLDQTLSRAKFNAKALSPGHMEMGPLPDAEIRAAIDRLSAPAGSSKRMPPAGARILDDAGRDRLIDYLRRSLASGTVPAHVPADSGVEATLRQHLAAHRVWLDTEGRGGVRADLEGLNLDGTDLQDASLQSAKLSDVSLRGADLRRANLAYIDLERGDLTDANLEGANLEGANLRAVTFHGANLAGANLAHARLIAANVLSVQRSLNFRSVNLRSANLSGARLAGADLSGANLSAADLSYVDLTNADFEGVNLAGAYLEGAVLRGANVRDTIIDGADLSRANLIGVRGLTQAWLDRACGSPQTMLEPAIPVIQEGFAITPCP